MSSPVTSASMKGCPAPTLHARPAPFLHGPDGSQALHAELGVDPAPGEIVHDHHVMSETGEVEGGRPAAETVSPEHEYFHLYRSFVSRQPFTTSSAKARGTFAASSCGERSDAAISFPRGGV